VVVKTVVIVALAFFAGACSRQAGPAANSPPEPSPAGGPAGQEARENEINPRLLRRFQPVAGQGGSANVTAEKISLGRMLFFEKRLSKGQELSCNSCHELTKHGVDGRAKSVGHKGQLGTRNAPTVYNAATHIAQFWDGRVETVEKQATQPIVNPVEMANDEKRVVQTLSSIPRYVEAFRAAYPAAPQPITLANVGDAIGAFERGLATTSRWDQFIAGKTEALDNKEKHGLRIFLDAGCMACHTGPQVGASMFQRTGVMEPWPNQTDVGRAAVTKAPADKMMFKVPSLKNIAETGPYFHDGSARTLKEAIRMMGRYQVGMALTDEEIDAIATWMRSLTGTIDPGYIAMPQLPASSDRTPGPVVD
jgi:cytochrome c peroxidase